MKVASTRMTVMMSLLVRPNFPLSTLAKGKLYAKATDFPVAGCMSLGSKKMEHDQELRGAEMLNRHLLRIATHKSRLSPVFSASACRM
jgi:hypothetical protein